MISVKAGLVTLVIRIRCIATVFLFSKNDLDLLYQTAFNHTSTAIIPSTHTQIYIHIYLHFVCFSFTNTLSNQNFIVRVIVRLDIPRYNNHIVTYT